jgi:hypothetical protein
MVSDILYSLTLPFESHDGHGKHKLTFQVHERAPLFIRPLTIKHTIHTYQQTHKLHPYRGLQTVQTAWGVVAVVLQG